MNYHGFSQVGINTTSPNAQLDIRSSNQATPTNTDGILIPKIDAFPVTNPTAAQNGMLVYLTTTSAGKSPGFYYWNNPTASWLPVSKTDDDWYEVGSTNPPNDITDDMFHSGNVAIGKTSATSKLDVEQTTSSTYAVKFKHSNPMNGLTSTLVNNEITSNQAGGTIVGVNNLVEANNGVQGYGTYNNLQGNTTGTLIGTGNVFPLAGSNPRIGNSTYFLNGTGQRTAAFNNFAGSGGLQYGVYNNFVGTPTNTSSGMYNAFGDTSTASKKGVYNSFVNDATTNGDNYGLHNVFDGVGGSNKFGVRNEIGGFGGGTFYGDYNTLTNFGVADLYGSHSVIDGSGTGDKIGTSVLIYPSAGGNHYGIRSIVTKPTGFAGYFLGRVSVGDTDANKYILPLTKGTNGQIMQTDGSGNVTWQNPSTVIGNNYWSTIGNSGTNASTNFIGTTDNVDLVFKRNAFVSGKIGVNATSFGLSALSNAATTLSNSAFGSNALSANTFGNFNAAFGSSSLASNTTGNGNTAIGEFALHSNTTGEDNTATGYYSLQANTTGNNNTANGDYALLRNVTGNDNTAIGKSTLFSNISGGNNTAVGRSSLFSNTIGSQNTATGYYSLSANTTGMYNTANGYYTLSSNTIGSYNTANGNESLFANTTGNYNVANGSYSLHANTTGTQNTAIGFSSLSSNTIGSFNTANGYFSLGYNTTGNNNTAMGIYSLLLNTSGAFNVANGGEALYSNSIGNNNVGIGYSALRLNTTGDNNAANGTLALYSNTSGDNNTANGYTALRFNTTGSNNSSLGSSALYSNTTGNNNVAIGYGALHENNIGNSNIAIGIQAGYNETGSNKLYIENSNSATPLIYGEFDTDLARINGNFRVNSTTVAGEDMQIKNSNLFVHNQDANLNFGTGSGYFMMSTQDASAGTETGGIRGDGDNVSIWSPGDGGRQLRILDEDSWTDNNGNPYDNAAEVAYIAPNGQYFQVSDRNKKENIQKIQNATSKITQISGYTYQFKLKPTEVEKGEKPTVSSGVLAQEIEQVLPEAIQKNEYGEYFVDYAAITPLLIEAIKEQNTKIQSLEERLKRLEEKLSK